jgi:hypothetical protein
MVSLTLIRKITQLIFPGSPKTLIEIIQEFPQSLWSNSEAVASDRTESHLSKILDSSNVFVLLLDPLINSKRSFSLRLGLYENNYIPV